MIQILILLFIFFSPENLFGSKNHMASQTAKILALVGVFIKSPVFIFTSIRILMGSAKLFTHTVFFFLLIFNKFNIKSLEKFKPKFEIFRVRSSKL